MMKLKIYLHNCLNKHRRKLFWNAGDGSSATVVLAYNMFKESQKYISSGCSVLELKKGMEKGVEIVLEELNKRTKKVKTISDIEKVATTSANNDEVIGKLIATAIDRIGKDGSILIKEGKTLQTSMESIEGFRFSSGYLSAQFITNEKKQTLEYNDPLIFITDYILETVEQILPVLELVAREQKPFIVVAEEIKGQALAVMIANTLRGSMSVAALTPPSFRAMTEKI